MRPRQVYYNGTSERFWWNQNAEAVCVYVPVPPAFDVSRVEFVAKTGFVSLKLEGEEVRPARLALVPRGLRVTPGSWVNQKNL